MMKNPKIQILALCTQLAQGSNQAKVPKFKNKLEKLPQQPT
jgi:hypothetical protein